MAATCRSCGAPVIWCLTANGKRLPLDADQWRQRPTQVCQCVACGHKFVNRTSACPKCKEMVP